MKCPSAQPTCVAATPALANCVRAAQAVAGAGPDPRPFLPPFLLPAPTSALSPLLSAVRRRPQARPLPPLPPLPPPLPARGEPEAGLARGLAGAEEACLVVAGAAGALLAPLAVPAPEPWGEVVATAMGVVAMGAKPPA